MFARILRSPLSLLGLGAVVYLGLAVFSIDKPLTMDEAMPTAYNAAAIADLGFDALGFDDYYYEISHTLLHQHILALFYMLFGETNTASRLVGVVCTILALFLIFRLSAHIFPGEEGRMIGGIAALLYATNPFVIQFSLVVDQETTVAPVAVLLFVLAFYRTHPDFSLPSILKLGSLLALCAWAKEYTPLFLLVALFVYLSMARGLRDTASVTVQIGLAGGAVFAATWIAYCLLTGVPILSFVEFSLLNKALNPDYHQSHGVLRGLAILATVTGRWVTPAFLILLGLAAIHRLLSLRQAPQARPADFVWVYVVLLWTAVNLYMIQPRYQFPLYSLAVILVAEYVWLMLKDARWKHLFAAVLIGVALAILLTWFFDDPLLREGPVAVELAEYVVSWVVAPLALIAVSLFALGAFVRAERGLVLSILALLLATGTALNVKQTRSYTTAMNWGISGYGETGLPTPCAIFKKTSETACRWSERISRMV